MRDCGVVIGVLPFRGLMVSKTFRSSGVNDFFISRFIQRLVLTEGDGARGEMDRNTRSKTPNGPMSIQICAFAVGLQELF
jgi:hypothetical protein